MTKMEALKELAAKVEAGIDQWSAHQVNVAMGGVHVRKFYEAMHGSLDAAKALHEAVLPHYTRDVDATAPDLGIDVTLHPVDANGYAAPKPMVKGSNAVEARAWLLAILRALIAQEAEE